MRTVYFALVSSVLAVALLWSAACGGGAAAVTANPTTTVTISDPAVCSAPSGPYSHVYVTVTDVQASTSSSATSGLIDLTPNLKSQPMQIDLLGQANNQCFLATLGSSTELQPGTYQQIRLILAANTTTVSNNQCGGGAVNCVVLSGGATHTLDLSSETQTGIKIPSGQIASGGFTVAAGQTKDLDIDFDTCDSLVAEGNGNYRLKPVLHAGEVSTTATSINGTVVDKATSQPVSGTTMVALEQKDSGGIDRIVMLTQASSSGQFVFCPVPAGSYDVVAIAISSSNVIYAPTLTANISPGAALGSVPLLAAGAPGSIAGQVSTSTGTAATSADIALSALQTASVNGANLTFTLPLVNQSAGMASLSTAAGAGCPANSDCASYTLQAPGAGAYAGVFTSSGTTWAQASATSAPYTIEADASASGASDCSPATLTTSTPLTLSAGLSLDAAALAFTGCQ